MSYTFAPWQGARSCTGSVAPGARVFLAWALENFAPPMRSGGIYNCRTVVGGSTTSIHGEGRAIDLMLPTSGGRPTEESKAIGYEIVELLGRNGLELGIQCIIWDRTIWSALSPNGRVYTGTHPHYDHLHIELDRNAAQTLTLAKIREVTGKFPTEAPSTPTVPAPTPPAPRPCDAQVFRRGDTGTCVRELQTALGKHGARIVVDGIFGPATDQAVKAFQGAKRIAVDGIVGPVTWRELKKAPAAPATRTMYVVPGGLHVRAGRGTNHRSLGILRQGQAVQVSTIVNGWAQVHAPIQGYSSAQYLAPSAVRRMTVTANSLHIRSGPGTQYRSIGALKKGQVVEVESVSGGWAKLMRGGYSSATYLR